MRSSLASVAGACREPDPAAARRAARVAYHETGLVLINPDWLTGWADQQQLKILADKVHGPRRSLAEPRICGTKNRSLGGSIE